MSRVVHACLDALVQGPAVGGGFFAEPGIDGGGQVTRHAVVVFSEVRVFGAVGRREQGAFNLGAEVLASLEFRGVLLVCQGTGISSLGGLLSCPHPRLQNGLKPPAGGLSRGNATSAKIGKGPLQTDGAWLKQQAHGSHL